MICNCKTKCNEMLISKEVWNYNIQTHDTTRNKRENERKTSHKLFSRIL